jgi:hypothetical protein
MTTMQQANTTRGIQAERPFGVLLDLNNGSLLFFKNGVQHGPGYAAGSVAGPVVAAVELSYEDQAVQLHADVAFPAGHAQTA